MLERCFDLFFELIIIFSSISRKSSWENDDTIVDSSFVIDTVADVSLESGSIVGEGLFFLSMTEEVLFSMSYEARIWRLYTFCDGCKN